jgi:hypothetical protein
MEHILHLCQKCLMVEKNGYISLYVLFYDRTLFRGNDLDTDIRKSLPLSNDSD